jgi:hypothetical protein
MQNQQLRLLASLAALITRAKAVAEPPFGKLRASRTPKKAKRGHLKVVATKVNFRRFPSGGWVL